MKYKLVCIDIDGTLLNDEKKIPEQVKECLRNLSDQGIRIALASGRMPAGIDLIEKELGIECIKICNAGAYILVGEKCIAEECLSNNTMRDVYRMFAEKNGIPMWIFQKRYWFVTAIDKFIKREVEIIPYQPEIVVLDQLAEKWDREDKRPNKLLLAAEPEKTDAIYREMKAHNWRDIDMARSAYTFIEIFPKGIDKGKALKTVCRKLDIDPKATIAIGDQELDIPMIEAAGVGIAMGNAIASLKEKADFVTRTNNEAGVAYALEHLLKV